MVVKDYWKDISKVDLDGIPDYIRMVQSEVQTESDKRQLATMAVFVALNNLDGLTIQDTDEYSRFVWDVLGMLMPQTLNVPCRLLVYPSMLDPSAADIFTTIEGWQFEAVQEIARKILNDPESKDMSEEELNHVRSIVEGNVPFGLKINGDA